jgi:hypothetical protein
MHDDLTAIVMVARPHHQTTVFGAVNELDCAVLFKLQPLCQSADPGLLSRGQAANRQHKLILLRVQASRPRRLLAEVQEAAYLIAEFCLRDKFPVQGRRRFYVVS